MSVSSEQDGPDWPVITRFQSIGIVAGVMFMALLLGEVFAAGPLSWAEQTTGTTSNIWFTIGTALSFVGMAAGGLVYLFGSGRGLDYVDVTRPTRETIRYTAFGVIASITAMIGFNLVALLLDLPVAESWVAGEIGGDMQMAALFLLLVFLFNAPVEEFLFRNVIQKRLGEVYSTVSAIFLTSSLFALIHVPGYLLSASMAETVAPIGMIFAVSIVFGAVYAYTEDLVVAAASHAIYNFIQISLYLPSILQ